MNKIVSVFTLVFASFAAQAESILDNTMFGVSVINQDVNVAVKLAGTTVNVEESGTGFGVYLDKYHQGKYRFNTTLSYVGYDAFDFASMTVAADYLVPYNKQLSFFAGVSAGGGMQQYADMSLADASSGLLYGAQLGGIAYLNKELMLEVGYRQRIVNVETDIDSGGTTLVDEQSELYLSFLLMF